MVNLKLKITNKDKFVKIIISLEASNFKKTSYINNFFNLIILTF